ncbi:MAG TPA: hypothetical protein VHL80_13940 [Polyangia bacterium]|nr:hypothetical protein [Polyangia bacterium]
MTSKRAFLSALAVSSLLVGVLAPGSADAKPIQDSPRASATEPERVQPLLLADVVVNGAQQPAPAPAAPAPVVVQPQPAAAPVVEPSPHRTTVVEHEPHNDMATITVSALAGAVAGVLVGGAIYYLADNQTHANRILYWGAGGVLVGAGVGVVQVVSQESRLDRAVTERLPTDPAPTYRLSLCRLRF